MQLLRGQPWSVGNYARAGDGGVQADSAVFCARQGAALRARSFRKAALSRDYDPMTKIFREVIARTLKSVAKISSG
jgi:hypothetical protein